jgi:hypothetical protein
VECLRLLSGCPCQTENWPLEAIAMGTNWAHATRRNQATWLLKPWPGHAHQKEAERNQATWLLEPKL